MNIENKQLLINFIMLINIIFIMHLVSGYINIIEYDIYKKNEQLTEENFLKMLKGEEIEKEFIKINPFLLVLIMIQIVLIIENLFNLTKYYNLIQYDI